MATLEERIKQSNRRGSAVAIQSNPIESGVSDKSALKVENLSDCRLITPAECEALLEKLKGSGNNEAILNTVESDKVPFLFTSDSLARILTCTTSVKTRLAIILSITPRLTDPRTKVAVFTEMFRFSEEKAQVEEAFKARIQAINGSMFKKESSSILTSPAGRGGRGRGAALSPGRGDMGGRGVASISLNNKPRAVSLPSIQLSPEMVTKSEVERAAAEGSRDSDDDSEEEEISPHVPFAASRRPFSLQITSPVSVFTKVEENKKVEATSTEEEGANSTQS